MSGSNNEMMGGLKKGLGKLTGNEALEAEGAAQKNLGTAERKSDGAMDELKGNVKKGAGKVLGSPTLQAEGEAERLGGKAKQI